MTPQGEARASGFQCETCGSVLKTRGNLKRHIRSLHGNYECLVCKKRVQTEKKLMFHMKQHSSQRDYKCSLCSKAFSSIRSLASHKAFHTRETMRPSPIQRSCKTASLVPEPLKTKKAVSGVKAKTFSRLKCTFCQKGYTSKDTLRRHLQLFHRKPVGKAKKVSSHTNTASSEENMIVSIPVQVSVSPRKQAVKKTPPHTDPKKDLGTPTNGHMQGLEDTTHLDNDRPFKCSLCDKAYSIKGSLNKHMRLKHAIFLKKAPSSLPSGTVKVEPHHSSGSSRLNGEIPSYRCGSCDTLLDSLEAYRDHLLRHSSKSRFRCTLCSKPFPSASKLWVHQRRQHVQYRHRANQTTHLFPCSVCRRTYNTPDEREQHMRGSHGPCPICGRVLSSKLCYKNHMNIHLGRRPYKCPKCPMRFHSHKSLIRHKCHQTGKRVKRKQVITMAAAPILKRDGSPLSQDTSTVKAGQMSVQPVIVPFDNARGRGYKCVLCGKILSRLGAFKSHMNLHTGAQPFTCQYCDATFSHSSAKWRHMLGVHSDGQTTHTNHLQTAKKPRASGSLTSSSSCGSSRKAKQDILTISLKTTSGQQESTPQPSKEDHDVLCSTSLAGSTTPTSPNLGPSFSCGVCGATMQRYASYMAHMTQHTAGTPGRTTPRNSAVAIWDKKLRHSSRPRVKSPRTSDGKVSSHKLGGKRHTCKLCGGAYSNLKRHMYVAHPLPKSFRMKLRRSGRITDKKDSLELPQSVEGDNMVDMTCEVQCSSESWKSPPDNHVVDGGVSGHHVLPVCGEVQVNGEDQACTTDSHSDTVLVKYGSWNVFFFGDNEH